jgi:hypothetical protein
MTAGELADKHLEVFGTPTRSRNKTHLRKKIAWQIQAQAEGGLSRRTQARITQLASEAPVRRRPAEVTVVQAVAPVRDPRLPPPGTEITRTYRGQTHVVTVQPQGFEYRAQHFTSLSKIARIITGTSWNGFLFFGLQRRSVGPKDKAC